MNEKTKYISLEDENNYFYISDLEVASILVALGHELVSTDKINEHKFVFIFSKTKNIEDVIDSFLSGRLEVNALAFSNARKNLKSRIYSRKSIDY